jgi:pimeloyl-ACP methyl ester carboxylesterase
MADDQIPYDPSKTALFNPEKRPAISDFSTGWELDSICAELSRLAYIRHEIGPLQEAELTKVLAKAGFGKPGMFNDKKMDAQGFGTTTPEGTAIIAFRGTQVDRLHDMVSDARFWPVRWDGPGRVHLGFRNAFYALRAQVDAWLASQPGRTGLVVTGHSLGAATATMMAAAHSDSILVTFGSPRVGGRAFAKAFEGRDVRRYVDCTDVVSRVPPPVFYRHICERHYVDHAGTAHYPPPDFKAVFRDRWEGRGVYLRKYALAPGSVPFRSGADHAPINYVSAVLGRRPGP